MAYTSYELPELYKMRISNNKEDFFAIERLCSRGCVAEVGSGTGRVLEHLRAIGCARIVGYERDLSRAQYSNDYFSGFDHVQVVAKDFCDSSEVGIFDTILFTFNVFAEFLTPLERVQALKRSSDALKPDGQIIITTYAHNFALYARSNDTHERNIGGDMSVKIMCRRSQILQTSSCKVIYYKEGHRLNEDKYETSLLTRNELLTSFIAANLKLSQEYGSWKLDRLSEESDVFIHVLNKK